MTDPTANSNVTQYQFFNYSVRIACNGGECDSYNASLDPPAVWDNSNYEYRIQVNLTEPQGVRRSSEHVKFNVTLLGGKLPLRNENGTSLYCNGTRVRWDAYATNTSTSWITGLEGLAELDFLASEKKQCFLYFRYEFFTGRTSANCYRSKICLRQ
jgi:hypothetical protein